MTDVALPFPGSDQRSGVAADNARLVSLVRDHLRYVFRLLRRIGLAEADADDVSQLVFITLSKKLDRVQPGSERAYLYKVAIYCASRHRRRSRLRREDFRDDLESVAGQTEGADELLEQQRARALLDAVVAALPMQLRVVLVLFEIENLQMLEIAQLLDVPVGTVASRLRRAREAFQARLARVAPKWSPKGAQR